MRIFSSITKSLAGRVAGVFIAASSAGLGAATSAEAQGMSRTEAAQLEKQLKAAGKAGGTFQGKGGTRNFADELRYAKEGRYHNRDQTHTDRGEGLRRQIKRATSGGGSITGPKWVRDSIRSGR
jgi:hypothetical protein